MPLPNGAFVLLPRFPRLVSFIQFRRTAMGIIIWLIVGGIVGWIASMVMRRDSQQGVFLNIVVGIVGAVLAGWLISPLVGVGTINNGLSVGSFLVSLLGAVILLAIVNLFRRGTARG
jgi:uncharacterized membrane protein YeaQ/YmgE (transglycosylase-associated protein family)